MVTSKPWEQPRPNLSAISNPLYLFVDPNDTPQGKDPGTLQEKPQPILILVPTLQKSHWTYADCMHKQTASGAEQVTALSDFTEKKRK